MKIIDHRIVFPFMSLPGKLRNMVYAAVLAMEKPGCKIHIRHRRPESKDKLVPYSMRFRKRQFMGLTYASRAARHDFRPPYLATMELRVPINEVPHYIDDFSTPDPARYIMVGNVLETLKTGAFSFMHQPIHLKPLLAIDWSQQSFRISLQNDTRDT
jgi:hypothetical protein